MDAIKRLLPSNWDAIKDEDVKSLYIRCVGFEEIMTIHNDTSMTDSFGYTYTLRGIGSIKEFIERLVLNGFSVEINTKQKKEELT